MQQHLFQSCQFCKSWHCSSTVEWWQRRGRRQGRSLRIRRTPFRGSRACWTNYCLILQNLKTPRGPTPSALPSPKREKTDQKFVIFFDMQNVPKSLQLESLQDSIFTSKSTKNGQKCLPDNCPNKNWKKIKNVLKWKPGPLKNKCFATERLLFSLSQHLLEMWQKSWKTASEMTTKSIKIGPGAGKTLSTRSCKKNTKFRIAKTSKKVKIDPQNRTS